MFSRIFSWFKKPKFDDSSKTADLVKRREEAKKQVIGPLDPEYPDLEYPDRNDLP